MVRQTRCSFWSGRSIICFFTGFLPSSAGRRRHKMKKLMILAALAAVSIGQPASAQKAPNPSVAVAHKDLDLRTEAGAKALDRRIWRAVVQVCGTASDIDLAGKNDVRQ